MKSKKKTRRVALVAGASRGIGEAVAQQLAQDGWDLALVSRTGGKKLDRVAAACRKAGAKVFHTKSDLAVEGAAEFLVAESLWVLGRLDALVHCAGDYSESSLKKQSYREWQHLFRSNLDTAFLTARAALAPMRKQGKGRIVFFGLEGISDFRPRRKCAAYAAAKTALLSYAKSLAAEQARHGVLVRVVNPRTIAHKDSFPRFRRRAKKDGSVENQLRRIARRIAALLSSTSV